MLFFAGNSWNDQSSLDKHVIVSVINCGNSTHLAEKVKGTSEDRSNWVFAYTLKYVAC